MPFLNGFAEAIYLGWFQGFGNQGNNFENVPIAVNAWINCNWQWRLIHSKANKDKKKKQNDTLKYQLSQENLNYLITLRGNDAKHFKLGNCIKRLQKEENVASV